MKPIGAPTKQLTLTEEAERFLSWGQDRWGEIANIIDRQFTVLHNRAQVLLGLCGIVISTTGFSGRVVAGTNTSAQVLIIAGVSTILIAGALVVWGVQHIRWLTQQPGEDLREWLVVALAYRDRKTTIYRVAIAFLLLGLALYVGAVAIMLAYPKVDGLPAR